MAKCLNYEAQIQQGNTIQSWHVSQSVDAFTGADDYDITVSGSLTLTGSAYLNPGKILSTGQNYVLTYNNTTGQIFKALTSSITANLDGGGDTNQVTFWKTADTISGSNNLTWNGSKLLAIGAISGSSTLTIGSGHTNSGTLSSIGGGINNCLTGNCSFIGGGTENTASAVCTGILGGTNNYACETESFIIGSNITSTAACTTFVNNFYATGSNGSSNVVILANLPTANPLNPGQLWVDTTAGCVLKVSQG